MDCLRYFYLFELFLMCFVFGNNILPVTPVNIKYINLSPSPTQVVGGKLFYDVFLAKTNFQINFVINGDIAWTCRYNVSSTCECTQRIGSIYNNRTYIPYCKVRSQDVITVIRLDPLTLTDKNISVTTIDGLSLASEDLDVQYCGNQTSDGIIQDVPANKDFNSRHKFTCMSGYIGMNLHPYCDWGAYWHRVPLCIFVKAPLTLATFTKWKLLPGSNITASISLVTNSTYYHFKWIISNTVVGNCNSNYCYRTWSVYYFQVSFSVVKNVSSVELSMRFHTNAIPASYNISLQGQYDSSSFGNLELSTSRCGNPSQAGVSAAPANSGFGASHTFTCTTGYTGTATGLSTCQADGTWSLEGIPTCITT